MKVLGWIMMAAGFALCCFALGKMPTTAEEAAMQTLSGSFSPGQGTLNIGLLQDQHMIFEAGLALFVAGAVFVSAGVIAGVVRRMMAMDETTDD